MRAAFLSISILLGALSLSGCFNRPAPVVYYVLQPAMSGSERMSPLSSAPATIGVGPVTLPAYLDRSAIVTRSGPNRLMIHDSYRWAAPLQSELLRVLAIDIAERTGTAHVVAFPWPSAFQPELRVIIQVRSFEKLPENKVRLEAHWHLVFSNSERTPYQRTSTLEQPVNGPGFDALVAAMGKALDLLSNEISMAISGNNSAGPLPADG